MNTNNQNTIDNTINSNTWGNQNSQAPWLNNNNSNQDPTNNVTNMQEFTNNQNISNNNNIYNNNISNTNNNSINNIDNTNEVQALDFSDGVTGDSPQEEIVYPVNNVSNINSGNGGLPTSTDPVEASFDQNAQPSANAYDPNNVANMPMGMGQDFEIPPYPQDFNQTDTLNAPQAGVEATDGNIPVILPTKEDDATLRNLKNAATPGGKTSLRIAGAALTVVVLILCYLGVEHSDPKSASDNKTSVVKPLPVKDIKSELKSNLASPEMGTCPDPATANCNQPTPTPVEAPPPVIVNTPPPPPPTVINTEAPPQVVVEKPVERPRQFAFRMRSGDEMVKDYEEKAKAKEVPVSNVTAPKVKIPRGTMLPLMMLQPFRNDIPTVVKCQILSDVKTSKGELLIPSGTTAFVPFAQFRNDKRVFNRVDSPMTIALADGTEIQLTGTAVDKSGGIGVAGKVIKKGDAGIGKRIGRTMARVLTFGAASAVGGVGGGVIAETGNATVDGSYYYTAPTTSYVEVPPGTVFFFNVSGN